MKLCRLVLVSALVVCILGIHPGWAQQPKPGGTLRIALPGDPVFYNAHQGPAMGAQAFWTSNNIYNSLLATTPPPELKIVPELARSWEALGEGRTYVFHLHEGVTFGQDWLRHPVGTGPFKFKEWLPGERVILEKNPNYFKVGLPYLDRLEYRIMKDPLTASTALRSGEIDFFSRVPMQQVPILEKSQGIHVITGLEMAPTIGFLNMRVKPFDDLRGRRAIGGYGLDRAEIAKVAFQGRAKPLVSVLAPGVQDAIDLNELYPYRPDEAKRLLKELGYDEKNPLRFTILISNQDMTMSDIAALIKNQMAKIGVETKITLVDAVTMVDRILVKHDFEMAVNNWATLRDINQRSVSFFKGRQSDYMGIDDPILEAMVLQWRRAMEPEVRKQLSAERQRRLADQLEWVNVTTYPFFQAYRTYVKNYPFHEQALVLFEQVWLDK